MHPQSKLGLSFADRMALFDTLPEEIGDLICGFISALDLDLEDLWQLRCVSKAWKQAVEEEKLGSRGCLFKTGLLKFACRVLDKQQKQTYAGLGIMNEARTVLHVHPFVSGRYGKDAEGLPSGEVWVDIPESLVVIKDTLYVLSEPKLPPGEHRVKKMRLRSYRESSWTERRALEFVEGEAPMSPTAECLFLADKAGPSKSSFTVHTMSDRYLFVLHYVVFRELSPVGPDVFRIKSVRANLYDTFSDKWSPFALPNALSRPAHSTPYKYHPGNKLGNVLSAANSDAIFLFRSKAGIFMHSLKAEELQRPWKTVLLKITDGGPRLALFAMLASGRDDNVELKVPRYGALEGYDFDLKLSTFRPVPDQGLANPGTSESVTFTMVEELERKWHLPRSQCNDICSDDNVHSVDNDLLITSKVEGVWQGTEQKVDLLVGPSKSFHENKGIQLWSRILQ